MVEGERNPSFEGLWVDDSGRVWLRKGKRGRVLEDRRVRTLLRRDDVPLVVWRSFEATCFTDAAVKQVASEDVRVSVAHDDDVVASEWRAEGGRLLLMLELLC